MTCGSSAICGSSAPGDSSPDGCGSTTDSSALLVRERLPVEELLFAAGRGRAAVGGFLGANLRHGVAVGCSGCCFLHALGLLHSLAPNGAKRLFLLALDLILGRSVLALQLEMLLDRIVE